MNRKILLLNLALVAFASVLGWQLRQRWLETRAHERAVIAQTPRGVNVLAPPPVEPPKPVTAAEYIEVAQKTLFSKDRNPNVVPDVPPPQPPAPVKPMPALPSYFGQMALGDPIVLLALGPGQQKSYHAGDQAGPFKVVSFDRDNITFEWEEKTVERKLSDLIPKDQTSPQQGAASVTPAPAPFVNPPKPSAVKEPALGTRVGEGFACVTGDNSPAGTILNGYKKVVVQSLMGPSCHWEQVK